MSPPESANKGMRCFKCGKLATNIHLCKVAGISQISCDDCCKKMLNENKCNHRECGHYQKK
ncbi:MAG: hypothetical protein HWN66_03870 [Candidatus Helarchaeota archaeon]|nr:hypothetical protein [Candidatus Helarchaeota archaeon]